jgi:hypothetical protein
MARALRPCLPIIFPISIGKKVRNHREKGCISHDAYIEVYGSDEPSPKKSKQASDDK